MDRVKELFGIVFGSSLVVDGKGRTYAKAPVWLLVVAALISLRLALVTAVLVVAFGMRASIVSK